MELIKELENYLDQFKQGRRVEMIQPLCDLGYLSLLQNENVDTIDPARLENAVRRFRADYEKMNLLTKRYSFYEPNEYSAFAHEFNTVELDFIHTLTSLEGDFIINVLPSPGEINLYTRIIHFRLNLLGLYGSDSIKNIDAPFSDKTITALNKINAFFNQNLDLNNIINLTGNLPQLEEYVLSNAKGNRKFIYIPADIADMASVLKNNSIPLDYNYFLSRVMQLFLWTHGLYEGRIDADIREMTEKSIDDLITLVNINETGKNAREYRIENFYSKINKQFKILNFVDILKLLPNEYINDTDNLQPGVKQNKYNSISELIKGEKIVFDEKLFTPEQINEIVEDTKKNFLLGRRIYYQSKRLISTILSGITVFIQKLVNKIKGWWDVFKNFLKLLFKEIRTSLTIFLHGLKFLFGKRIIQTESIYSKFELDFDNYSFIGSQVPSTDTIKHIKKCRCYINSLDISLDLTGIILHTVLYAWSGVMNYINLFFLLAEEYKKIKESKILYGSFY